MRKKDVAVTAVAALLGILSAALGFAAEVKRVKAGDVQINRKTLTCIYPKSPAGILGLAAAATLVVAQITVHGFAGCICCRNNRGQAPGRTWRNAWIVFVFAWITYFIGIALLLRAAALNRNGERLSAGIFLRYCYVVMSGVSAAGAALGLISVLLGIIYYHLVLRLKKEDEAQLEHSRQEIPMAQPQFPAQPPVFVHEDTYNRRQMP